VWERWFLVIFCGKNVERWFLVEKSVEKVIFSGKLCGNMIFDAFWWKKCGKGDFWWFFVEKMWKSDFWRKKVWKRCFLVGNCVEMWFLMIFDEKKCGKVIFGDFWWKKMWKGDFWWKKVWKIDFWWFLMKKKCGKVIFVGKCGKMWFLMIFNEKKCG